MQIIDGYGGRPHIEAFEVRELNASLHGPGDYVADIGDKMGCEVVTNNKIQVKSGAVLVQGCRGINPVGSIVDMIIENGKTGDNRNDLIVVRYSKDPVSSEEKMKLAVVKGKAVTGGAAADPKVVTGNLRDGDTLHEMPLYRVALQGLNIVKVTPLFQTIRSTVQLSGLLDDVNAKVGPLSSLTTGVRTSIVNAINWLKAQVASTQSTLDARTNGKAKIWEDGEGGNIQVESPNGVKWQMDAYNGNFRLYRNVDGTISPSYYFPGDVSNGNVLLSSKIINTLANLVANTKAGLLADSILVKSMLQMLMRSDAKRTVGYLSDLSRNVYRKTIRASMANWVATTDSMKAFEIDTGEKMSSILKIDVLAVGGGRCYPIPYSPNGQYIGTRLVYAYNIGSSTKNVTLLFENNSAWGSAYTLMTTIEYLQ